MEKHRVMTESQEKELEFTASTIADATIRFFMHYYVNDEFGKIFVRTPERMLLLGGSRLALVFLIPVLWIAIMLTVGIFYFAPPPPHPENFDFDPIRTVLMVGVYVNIALVVAIAILDICGGIYREAYLISHREWYYKMPSEKEPTEMKEVADKKSD